MCNPGFVPRGYTVGGARIPGGIGNTAIEVGVRTLVFVVPCNHWGVLVVVGGADHGGTLLVVRRGGH